MKTSSRGLNADLSKLYEELKSPQKVEDILKSFYTKMSQDMLVGFFFVGKDIQHIVNQQKMFILKSMGAESTYKGKVPSRAHTKLPPILKGHFDRRLVLLKQTLQEFGVSEEGSKTWLAFEESFRRGIVKEEGAL